MSTWIDITDPDDVEIDANLHEMNILYGSDDFGNNYISIPLTIVMAAIEKHKGE